MVHFRYTFATKPGIVETVGHCGCNKWNFQVGMRFSGSTVCIDNEVLPMSSKHGPNMLFQDPDMGCYLASAAVQFHLLLLPSFSMKGSGRGTTAF